MSLMSYTFASKVLDEEITLIITMPEKKDNEQLPFATAVLVPDATRESSYFMRKEPLERYGRGQQPMATVSLPGRVVMRPTDTLQAFLTDELPFVLGQFPLEICSFYVKGFSASRLLCIEEALQGCYRSLKFNTADETLSTFMNGM